MGSTQAGAQLGHIDYEAKCKPRASNDIKEAKPWRPMTLQERIAQDRESAAIHRREAERFEAKAAALEAKDAALTAEYGPAKE